MLRIVYTLYHEGIESLLYKGKKVNGCPKNIGLESIFRNFLWEKKSNYFF